MATPHSNGDDRRAPQPNRRAAPGGGGLLAGKRLLITGVMTKDSIAWAVADEAQRAGADIVLTSFGRTRRLTARAAKRLPTEPPILELDVNSPDDLAALPSALPWEAVDGVLHAIAYAPPEAIGGRFLDTPSSSALTAFETSAYSLKALTAALAPVFAPRASVVGLDFDATVAWPSYDWMGVSKAALESVSRYLARDLGPQGVRVNLVAAGPLRTAAASGIAGFSDLVDLWRNGAPLGWDPDDAGPVARTVCFMFSDWSDGITAEIVHVDGGFHAMGSPLEPRSAGVATERDVVDADPLARLE
jgi:enoyl ACP reductase